MRGKRDVPSPNNFVMTFAIQVCLVFLAAYWPTGSAEPQVSPVLVEDASVIHHDQALRDLDKRSEEFAAKGEDHEGGTWYLGKRSFFVGRKQQKNWKQLIGGIPWQFQQQQRKPTTPGSVTVLNPPTTVDVATLLPVDRQFFELDPVDIESATAPGVQGKRTRSPWGFRRSTKAAWYLGKRSEATVAPVASRLVGRSAGLSLRRAFALLKHEKMRQRHVGRGRLGGPGRGLMMKQTKAGVPAARLANWDSH
ncbi:hypothetical protein BV898_04982 [Hypsibius exemplaris]|uniref:Uncharacterized protein n=1 Tax=Hypsibius exemplaris TaxID=2072580 RepID=A0A1W0X0A7_HYPEX|nr:hypothetical protein BV898_04982 [Hypsibius exemplaris]